MNLRIESRADVVRWSLVTTALAVAVPTFTMLILTRHVPSRFMFGILAPTVAIPALITLPISLFALHMLRLLTTTINQVDRLVKFDPLTGVMSRSYFMETARERIAQGGCVMVVDADFFKRINDTYGHDVGDEALKIIARSLVQASDPDALVGRLGGEEFGICLASPIDREGAEKSATRVQEAVREFGAAIGDMRVGLTVSIGVQLSPPGTPLQHVIKGADVLLYEAKRAGRDRFVVSDVPPAK